MVRRETKVILSGTARWLLRLAAAAVLTFIYAPLALVLLNSFSTSVTFAWPPPGFTLRWWQAAATNEGVRTAIVTSVEVAVGAAAIAVVLGTLASMALVRYEFFGRDTVSLLVLLPIALPGIVTGIALNTLFTQALGGLTFFTLIVGHATFCIVIVVNNASARLRRMSSTAEEASLDLGATPWTTWWRVTLPALRGALFGGALLAFALSFDEIIVTTFTAGPGLQTLPLWIFQNLFRPNQAPIVNVAAVVLVVVSVLPVYLANRLSGGSAGATTK
jgi:putative spermidine/putrescine transport system permease protein